MTSIPETLTIAMALLLGLSSSMLIGFNAARLGRWLGAVDTPDGQRKLHPAATPLVGGFAVTLPTLAILAAMMLATVFAPFHAIVLGAAALSLALGYLDDRSHVRPLFRLAASIGLCLAAVLLVPGLQVTFFHFSFMDQALFLNGWAVFFTLLCLVGLQYAVNMADGRNGLAIGLALIWVASLMVFAPGHLLPVLWCLGAALLVAFGFNMKGRLFLGDSGSYAISLLVGILTIYTYSVSFARLPADLVALWFLIPVIDCLRLMVMRLARGQSPFSPDSNHLHHILDRRMTWRWGLPVYLGMVGVPVFAATLNPKSTLLWAVASLSVYVVILAVDVRAGEAIQVERARSRS